MSKTKRVLFVRHGDYDEDDLSLSCYGIKAIRALSEKIKTCVGDDSVLILSSPAKRADQSAEIISNTLHTVYQTHDILWSDSNHAEDFYGALDLIRSFMNDFDTIIVVTHLEYVEALPWFFGKEVLHVVLKSHEIGKGSMWDIHWHQSPQLDLVTPY